MSEPTKNKTPSDAQSKPYKSPRTRKPIRDTQSFTSNTKSYEQKESMDNTTKESPRNSRVWYTDDEDDVFDEEDDVFDEEDEVEYSNSDEISKELREHKREAESLSPIERDMSDNSTARSENEPTMNWITSVSVLIIIILVFYSIVYIGIVSPMTEEKSDSPEVILDNSIKDIRERFCAQDLDMWDEIIPSINDVVQDYAKLSIITLLANETNTMDCLAKYLGNISTAVLGSNEYIEVTPQNIGNDLGSFIIKLQKEIPHKRVVVVKDLLSINARMLRAFHNLCDKENPLVSKSVLIMTMVANGSEKLQSHKMLSFVENKLKEIVSGKIDEDTIGSLITRITSGIILQVQPERNLRHYVLNVIDHREILFFF